MNKNIVYVLLGLVLIGEPMLANASSCASSGTTIVYVNGILTSKRDAQDDVYSLKTKFEKYLGQSNDIAFISGYNESHGKGAGDVIETASQILNNPISNYDRDTILTQIHPQVTTQKILLVGHSQGTLYTNEIYDYLINHGVPKQALGVVNLATPSSFVAGDGAYLTSKNDKVINLVRGMTSALGTKQPLTANIDIAETTADSWGHSFNDVYLTKAPFQVISEISNSLKKLSAAEAPNMAESGCFTPPAQGVNYYAQQATFVITDSIASAGSVVKGAISAGVQSAADVASIGVQGALSFVKVINEKMKLASIADSISKLFSGGQNQSLKLAATADLNPISADAAIPIISAGGQKTSSKKSALAENGPISGDLINIQDFVSDTQNEDAVTEPVKSVNLTEIADQSPIKIADAVPEKPTQVCKFLTDKSPSHQKLILNEVAWMGTRSSANDEWIELRNISGGELDISGWQLLDKEEQIKMTFSKNTKIGNGAYVLLERTDDNSVPEIKADAIYAGALANSDEGLRLYDGDCNLADEVFANTDWPAGDSGTRKTMERLPDLSWHTYNGNGINLGTVPISGTPKAENSQMSVTSTGVPVANLASVSPVVDTASPAVPVEPAKILISEIQITGGTGKSNDDFVELYNPNPTQVNLNGYRLVKRTKTGTTDTSIKSWTSDAYIPARGYYLWANSDYASISAVPDITTSATLANDNGVALRYGAEDAGTIIDSVGWGSASNSFVEARAFAENPIANQSISRRTEIDSNDNSADFMKSSLSPKNSNTSGGFATPLDWSSRSAVSPSDHVLISEMYPDRTGANRDFVELYNPNAAEDISGWSLQVLSANATSTDKIIKKNFESGNQIPESGFFLVGIGGYQGADTASSPRADMSWAGGSLNSTGGATILLVNGTTTVESFEDPRIVDRIAYGTGAGLMFPENSAAPLPAIGKSLERKSLADGVCISAAGTGEFSGNGCDTDDNSADFEERSAPVPQNSANLNEPRPAPAAVQNFIATYATSTLQIFLQWEPSVSFSGATSTIRYALSYATSTSATLKDLATVTATSSYNFKINEVGVDYRISIAVKDRDGLASESVAAELAVPGIFNSVYFYPDPRNPGASLLEFRHKSYPFIGNPNQDADNWRVLIAYKNQEAPAIPQFYGDQQYAGEPDGSPIKQYGEWGSTMDGAWKFHYLNCSGQTTGMTALILPDTAVQCSSSYGGIRNAALDRSRLADQEDLNLMVRLDDDQAVPVSGDYATFGIYGRDASNAQVLLAVDRQKYDFRNSIPEHASPTSPANLELSFDPSSSFLRIIWDASKDPDTLDRNLQYEINYATTTLSESGWIPAARFNLNDGEYAAVGNRPFTRISPEPGGNYNISLRAKDDFGNISEATTTTFVVPDILPPYGISNLRWGYLSGTSTPELIFNSNPYPFMTADVPSAIIFFLNQSPPASYSFSNGDDFLAVGGTNRVLRLNYDSCGYGADDYRYSALVFGNVASCPGGWGIKQLWAGKNMIPGQSLFGAKITGSYDNGTASAGISVIAGSFTGADYITVGFYELSGGSFNQVAAYGKKIYFQE